MANEKLNGIIVSNLPSIAHEYIKLDLPKTARPRIFLKNLLENLSKTHEDKIIVLGIRFIGQRIVSLENDPKLIKLLSGRRHRMYYGIKFNKIIHINFTWHKLKYFSEKEMKFVSQNLNEEFFENISLNLKTCSKTSNGIFLIKKTGEAKLENYLYKIIPSLFI